MQPTTELPFKTERSEHLFYVLGTLLLLASIAVRILGYPIVTSDFTYFVALWFQALAQHPGLTAFQFAFSDYAPLYLYIIKFLAQFPFPSLYLTKTFSFLCDVGIASYGVATVRHTAMHSVTRGKSFFLFALVFSIPTVLINSSIWGQSDAFYTLAAVASLYYLLTDRSIAASIAYGVAVSIKVQALFFLPIYLGLLLRQRDRWYYLFIPIGVFLLSIVPAWMGGGSYFIWATIYLHEAGEYTQLSVSGQSIFAFITHLPLSPFATELLFLLGLLAAAAAALALIIYIARAPELSAQKILFLTAFCVLLIPFLLPRMHERYFYMADVFTTLYCLWDPRRWYLAALTVLASFLSYMPFLSGQVSWFSFLHVDVRLPALFVLGVLLWMGYLLRSRALGNGPLPQYQPSP